MPYIKKLPPKQQDWLTLATRSLTSILKVLCKMRTKQKLQLVIDHPENSNQIIAEIHCYKLIPKVFSHVLSELTIRRLTRIINVEE